MIKVAVAGCQGRMGKRITELVSQNKDMKITAIIERPDCPGVPDAVAGVKVARDINAIKGADVLVDFTAPEATMKNLEACRRHRVRMVIGTTGSVSCPAPAAQPQPGRGVRSGGVLASRAAPSSCRASA